jgi:NNP family nitrate/nitrite transporter-like MFS transporter
MLMGFGLFVKMSNGATYSVTPFINRNALGAVAGIVGAGGNLGAVAAGFLFKSSIDWPTCMLILGAVVSLISFMTFGVQFSPAAENDARREHQIAHDARLLTKPHFRLRERAPEPAGFV